MAEKAGLDLVTPCSSCYHTLNRVNSLLQQYPGLKSNVDECLVIADLKYAGRVRVRQLFEVIYSDIGLKFVESKVVNPLNGLKVAVYYGCQLVRPESSFDDPRNPQSLNHLVVSLGAEPVTFPLRVQAICELLQVVELYLGMSNLVFGFQAQLV